MNRGTSAIPGAAATETADAFAEAEAAPFGGIHAAGDQDFVGISDGSAPVFADGTDQALGEDAVERGDEVVGLDPHVEEAAQHVDHIVGVDGGEDEVSGQRGVDGDLGGFLVADFADEDLVGIVAQNRAKAAGKRQALLFIYRNLGNAADLVFDRVLDGDDFVFVALDLIERGVERGGFAGAGRAGDQYHAVGFAAGAAEAAQVFFGEAHHVEREVAELLAHRFLVEHAEHGVFAMHGGHDGDTEVDEAALVANAEAAVLRYAALSDVELAHDLDAAQDGGVMLARDGRHGFLQDSVDAVLHMQRIVISLDVDVRGASLESGEDGGVDQADDGTDVLIAGQLLDGDVFVGLGVVAGEDVEGQAFAGFVEDTLRLLGFLEQVSNLREGGDARDDAMTEQTGDFVEHHQPRRIADGNDEHIRLLLDGHEVVTEHQFPGNRSQQVVLNLEIL